MIFQRKWKNKNISVRLEWIGKADLENTKHLELLKKISQTDKEYLVRKSAYDKLGDNISASCEILNYASEKEKKSLLETINDDKQLLRKIATNYFKKPTEGNLLALREIRDFNILKEIIFETGNSEIKLETLQIIKNDNFLVSLLNHDLEFIGLNPYDIINLIQSQEILINQLEKLINGQNYYYAELILARIENQDIHKRIFVEEKTENKDLKLVALYRINDVKFLQSEATTDKSITLDVIDRLLSLGVPISELSNKLAVGLNLYFNGKNDYSFDFIENLIKDLESSYFENFVHCISDFLNERDKFLISKLSQDTVKRFGLQGYCSACNKDISCKEWCGNEAYCPRCKKMICEDCISVESSKFFDDERVDTYKCKDCNREFGYN